MSRLPFSRHTARAGSAVLLLQRAPLLKLLPEARVLTSAGFSDALRWAVTAVAGLGAFDSVAGATSVVQLQPSPGSTAINGVAGDPLVVVWQATGQVVNPSLFTISGNLPPGLTQALTSNSTTESASGIPTLAGDYPVVVSAWRNPDLTGDFVEQEFTFHIVNPPVPVIQTPPAGGNHLAGAFLKLTAVQTNGRTFTWSRNGSPLEAEVHSLFPSGGARRYRPAPSVDPGPAWRSGAAFDDSDATWSSVSGGIGYDTTTAAGVDFRPHIATGGNVAALMSGSGKPVSAHVRMSFTPPPGVALSYLRLRVQSDDGFVAWLNGTEVASRNKPAVLNWNSAASGEAVDSTAVTFTTINLSAHLPLLRAGTNLLAVQAMNRAATGDDFLFNCELEAGINDVNSPALILTSLQQGQTGEYTFTAANPAASVTTDPAGIYILPVIVQQPEGGSIESGSTIILSVTPTGSEPYGYQWYEGTSGDTSHPIAGAVEESYTTPALTASTSYWVRVTNPGGFTDSTTASITVSEPAVQNFTHWAAAHFTPAQLTDPLLSGAQADPDGDGLNNAAEYALGSLPLAFTAAPLAVQGGTLTFTAHPAAGAGYAGRTRRYTLETTASLSAGPWLGVAGFTGIAGSGQTLTFSPASGATAFYRLRVNLEP